MVSVFLSHPFETVGGVAEIGEVVTGRVAVGYAPEFVAGVLNQHRLETSTAKVTEDVRVSEDAAVALGLLLILVVRMWIWAVVMLVVRVSVMMVMVIEV